MKTFKKIGGLFASLAVMLVAFTACGPSAKNVESVATKIENGESLTESDYTVITDYCVEYAKKAQDYQNRIDSPEATDADNAEYTEKLASLTERYSYTDLFFKALNDATPEQVGDANVKKVNENADLMYFTAPSWATIQTSSDVEGFIEDMPDTDTSGVISQGDGEVVD